jgi:hypothetical protein
VIDMVRTAVATDPDEPRGSGGRIVVRQDDDGRWSVDYPDELTRHMAEERGLPLHLTPDELVFELPLSR